MGSVDGAVVTGEVHLHLIFNRDRAILGGHHRGPRGGDGQDGAGARRQNRIEAIHAKHPQVGKGEGAGAVLLWLELLTAGSGHQIGPVASQGIDICTVGIGQHRRDQSAVLHRHRHRHIHGDGIEHARIGGGGIHLRMAGQHHSHSLGQQGRHRDPLALHFFVEGVQFVGGDRVAHAETGRRQAGDHAAVHRLLQRIEGHGFPGPAKSLTDSSGGGGRRRGAGGSGAGARADAGSHRWPTAFRHPGNADRLAAGGQHVFRLNTAMGAAAPQGLQGHAQLASQFLGPRRCHHPAAIASHGLGRRGCGDSGRRHYRGRHGGSSDHWGSGHRLDRCHGGGRGRAGSGGGRWGLGDGGGDFGLAVHDQADGLSHRSGAAGRHQHRRQEAPMEGLHIHVGLVRFHHQHRLASLHPLAGLLEPLHDLALRHGGGQGRHEDVVGGQRSTAAYLWRILRGSSAAAASRPEFFSASARAQRTWPSRRQQPRRP